MLKLSSVGAGYGRLEVLHQVSLEVSQGEIVGIIGANGAGKSTVLNTIGGLVRLREGRIDFLGESIGKLAPHEIVARGIALVPQTRELFAQMSVRENLELAGLSIGSKAEIRSRLDEQLANFPRLSERLDQRASTMSGGEQQMLAIARALMLRPKLLLLDEPTMGLAPQVISALGSVIRKLNEAGQTILLVEQNLGLVLATTQKVYVLRTGTNVFEAETQRLSQDKSIAKYYLE